MGSLKTMLTLFLSHRCLQRKMEYKNLMCMELNICLDYLVSRVH